MNKVTKVTKACCVFRDFCEIWNQPKPKHIISRNLEKNLNGFLGWGDININK